MADFPTLPTWLRGLRSKISGSTGVLTAGGLLTDELGGAYIGNGTDQHRYLPRHSLIPSLEAAPAWSFGDSWGDSTGAPDVDAGTVWCNRLASRLRTQTLKAYCVSGTRSDQTLNSVLANWTPGGRGLVMLADLLINDTNFYGTATTQALATSTEVCRSIFAYLTSRAAATSGDTSILYGPGWTNGVSDGSSGRYVDLAFNGDATYVQLGFVTATGATVTFTNPDGSTAATATTGGWGLAFTGSVKLAGYGAGNHTVRMTTNAAAVTVVGMAVPSPRPPTLVWMKPGKRSFGTPADTLLTTFQTAVAAIVADFPSLISVDADAGWDNTAMIGPSLGHPNDFGSWYLTELAMRALQKASTTFRAGQNVVTTALAAYTGPSPAFTSSGATAPAAPTLTATTAAQVNLSWTVPTDGGASISSYLLEQSADGGTTWTTVVTLSAKTLAYSITTGLTGGSSYKYRVKAINSVGTGTASTVQTVTAGTAVTVYAADDFNRANGALGSTSVGGFPWTVTPGDTAAIVSNQMVMNNVGGGTSVAPPGAWFDDGQANGTLSVKLVGGPTSYGGLEFRVAADQSTGYVGYHDAIGGGYTLRKRTGANAYTVIGTAGSVVTPAAGDILSVVLNGSSITMKVNGTTVWTATDATYTSSRHGVFTGVSYAMTYDDYLHTSATS